MVIKRNVDNLYMEDFSSDIVHKNFNQISNYNEALEHTEKLLNHAVEKRLNADVPIGTLLSGGLDSGLITAMIAKKTDKITSFTAGFDDHKLDETYAAQSLAKHLGIKHQTLNISEPPESMIDDIAIIAGEPFADPAIMPLFMICDQAKDFVKVLISGDGGDELFAGYGRYASFVRQEKFKAILSLKTRKFLFQKLADIYPQNLNVPQYLRAGATFEALATTPQGGYLRNIAITRAKNVENILSDYAKSNRVNYNSVDHLTPFFADYDPQNQDAFNHARYADLKFWLPARMLPKADKASMAASIELRSPLLDLALTSYSLKLPYKFLKHPSGGKRILRDIAKKYVPHNHLMRPKQGFVMPISHLLKTSWAGRLEAVINDIALRETGLLNMSVLKKMMQEHFKGYQDHSRILWAIIQLEAFLRLHKFI
ncbi:MAG: asparagine synthase (glutamine-hydrolyzing) [Alphaproteobacteria bacterium]|jgi:asparagine synthase (glutamine-hydrolysing)